MSTPNKPKICLPCEREKAKLPTYQQLAKQRAKKENKTIAIYFDTEDKKYIRLTAKQPVAAVNVGACPYLDNLLLLNGFVINYNLL